MEPMPETLEALAEFVSLDDPDVDELLAELGRSAHAIVPDLVGLSLGLAHEGLTFTLLASNSGVASDRRGSVRGRRPVCGGHRGTDGLGRGRHGRPDGRGALAALLPGERGLWGRQQPVAAVYRDDRLVGGVNLYASTRDSFAGRQEQLVEALGGRAGEAVANADLSFSTRLDAAAAPQQMRDRIEIETATGLLAARSGADLEVAQRLLREAAARAGVPLALVARVLVLVHRGWPQSLISPRRGWCGCSSARSRGRSPTAPLGSGGSPRSCGRPSG